MSEKGETREEWKARLHSELLNLEEKEQKEKCLLKIEILTKILDLVKDL